MSKINDEFKILLKKFSISEDKLKEQQKITKELRGVRNNYQEKILEYIEKNNLKNVKLNFSNISLNYHEGEILPILNMDLLKTILEKYFNDKEKAHEVCNFVERYRNKNKKKSISLRKKKIRSKRQKR